jgi:glucuronokinase
MIIERHAHARAGLLGNPSDGYFGRTISIILRNFGAQVSLHESPELHIEPQEPDLERFRDIDHMVESVGREGYYGGARLVKAAIKKFHDWCVAHNIDTGGRNFTIRYHSNIPRQVGLAGSSAIVTATLRALMACYEVDIPLGVLPGLALSAEVDELGITAGLQDRVVQVYEGCVYMDFSEDAAGEGGEGVYEPLDPGLLPDLYVAYRTEPEKVSGRVLNDLRTRFEDGDPDVIVTLERIAAIAEEGRGVLLEKDHVRLAELINENFDLRSRIMKISDASRAMVAVARDCGASAKFTGSGGAIIGTYDDEAMLEALVENLENIGARVIRPQIVQ